METAIVLHEGQGREPEGLPAVPTVPTVPTGGADNDGQVIALWLHGRSAHTQRAYRRDVGRFLAVVGRPLAQVRLQDVQDFMDSLADSPVSSSLPLVAGGPGASKVLAQSSQARTVAAVKSLLSFAHGLGYLPFDVGAAVKGPKVKETLAERIMSEADLQRILALETHPRNSVLLWVLYASGARVSEICGLKWKDCQERQERQEKDGAQPLPGGPGGTGRAPGHTGHTGGQITVYGKGSKTRAIILPVSIWQQLLSLKALKGRSGPDDPVFRSRKGKAVGGGPLDSSQVLRIVQAAGERAGIAGVTPHWFRHAHATHALDRGAPIHLVQATLGHSSVATTGRYLHARPTESSSRFLVV